MGKLMKKAQKYVQAKEEMVMKCAEIGEVSVGKEFQKDKKVRRRNTGDKR